MKYKITLNGKTYEVEVEEDKAMLVDEYEAYAPAPAAAQPEEPAAEPAIQTAQPGPSIPAAQTTAQNSVLRIYVLIGAAVLLLVCILLRRLTRRR